MTELKNTVKIECQADPRMWLEFTRDISHRQRRAYVQAALPAADVLQAEAALPEAEREAAQQGRMDTMSEFLRTAIIDGVIIFEGGKAVQGIEAILDQDPDEMTITAADFLAAAPWLAMDRLRTLGNGTRLG